MSNPLESDSIEELDLTNSPDTLFTPATTHSASPVLTPSGGNEHRTTNSNANLTTPLSNDQRITNKLTHNFKSSKLKSGRKSTSKTYRYQPFPRAHAKMSGGTHRESSRLDSKEPKKQNTPAKKGFHLPSAQAKVDDIFRKLSSHNSNSTTPEESLDRPQEGYTIPMTPKKSSSDTGPLTSTPADDIATTTVTTHSPNYGLGTAAPRAPSTDSDQMQQAPRTPRPTKRSLKLNALALAAAQLAPRRPQRKSGRLMEEAAEGEGLASPRAVVGSVSGGGGAGSPRKAGGGRRLGGM